MARTMIALALALLASNAAAQDQASVQRMFEAGQFREAANEAMPSSPPAVQYLGGLSLQKLGDAAGAAAAYSRLADRQGDAVWQAIGTSALQLLQGQIGPATQSAQTAAAAGDSVPEAHYQLGLAYAQQQAWNEAAASFDRASELNPSFAYTHYYGGLMHYRAGRPDRMAVHFEQFLKLAPSAPERPEVLQIMRTIRGR